MTTSQAPVVFITIKPLFFGKCGYCGKWASECQFCRYGDNLWTEGKM